MIKLLSFTPNIHTLIFQSMSFYANDVISTQQSEIFRLVSNTNTITDITLNYCCSLQKLQLLVALCPRLQYLTINISLNDLESMTRFLLERAKKNTSHLFLLCISRATNNWIEKLEALIESEVLLDDYMLKLINEKLYLWW